MTTRDTTTGYLFSGFRLDARHKKLFNPDGRLVTLSARPFDALLTLLESRGRVLSREALMEAVWPNVIVEEHNLTQAISVIRKALNDTTSESQFIRTEPGRGYCFIAPVEELLTAAAPALERADAAVAPVRATRWLRPMQVIGVALALLGGVASVEREPPVLLADTTPAEIPAPLGISDIPKPHSQIRNSLAVLPLAMLSPEVDSLFTAGLHDELITQLTKIRSLNVIGRSSVVTLLDQGLSTLDITRVLRVESILSGTIRLADAQARISLQLLDVSSGVTLWSGTYDIDQQDLAEMISIQGDIALNVVSALKVEMPQRELDDVAKLPTGLFEAYRYNLAARNAHEHQNYAAEWHLAQKALALDPEFYDALNTFAFANVILVANPLQSMTSKGHADLALEYANRMIELAPERSEGYALLVATHAKNKRWSGVATALHRLGEMDTPLANLDYIAPALMTLGDFDKAIQIYDANLSTEVINPFGRGFLMLALELAGQRDEAQRAYATGEELHAQWWGDSVNVFLALGRGEALGDVEQLVGVSDALKHVLTQHGDSAAVLSALRAYQRNPAKRPMEARYYAALAAELGEQDLAVELLRVSFQDAWSIFWAWLPVFDATRQQAGFRDLLRESGLVSHWQTHGWPRFCRPHGNDFRCDWRAYAADSATAL